MKLRSLWDVSIPAPDQIPEGAVLLYDRSVGRWVARVLDVGLEPHQHPPGDITPQGEGSGLDADTVDGVHASGLAPATHLHPAATSSSAGFMSAEDKAKLDLLVPEGQLAFGKVRVGSTDLVAGTVQDILELVSSVAQLTLAANTQNKRVTFSLNQGAGSGLDADLLDGQHASAFAPASHAHTLNLLLSANTSSVTLNQTTSSPVTITSVNLSPGSWLLLGVVQYTAASSTSATCYTYLRSGTSNLRSFSNSAVSGHGLSTHILMLTRTVSSSETIALAGATSNTSYTFTVPAYGGYLLALEYAP